MKDSSPILDPSLCDFFKRPDMFYVANLESWAQRRRALGALLPKRCWLPPEGLSPDEQRYLQRVEIDYLTEYMNVAVGEEESPWRRFARWISGELSDLADWADGESFIARHHRVLTLAASYDGWKSDDKIRQVLTLAQGWSGAKIHGIKLLLPHNFLVLDEREQLGVLEHVVNPR